MLPIVFNVSDFTLDDSAGGRSIPGRVWLPKQAGLSYKGVLLIAHGFSGSLRSLQYYAEVLASHGYAVGALTHPDLAGLRSGKTINDPLVARPRQLSLLLDVLVKHLDAEAINLPVGLLGFSLGGYAALNAAGVAAELGRQPQPCTLPASQVNACCTTRLNARLANLLASQTLPLNQPITGRIKAVAVLAPAYTKLLDLSNISITGKPAVFLAAGRQDQEVDVADLLQQFRFLPPEHTMLMDNAGHYVYLRQCRWPWRYFSTICRDPLPLNRPALQRQLAERLLGFYDQHMH